MLSLMFGMWVDRIRLGRFGGIILVVCCYSLLGAVGYGRPAAGWHGGGEIRRIHLEDLIERDGME